MSGSTPTKGQAAPPIPKRQEQTQGIFRSSTAPAPAPSPIPPRGGAVQNNPNEGKSASPIPFSLGTSSTGTNTAGTPAPSPIPPRGGVVQNNSNEGKSASPIPYSLGTNSTGASSTGTLLQGSASFQANGGSSSTETFQETASASAKKSTQTSSVKYEQSEVTGQTSQASAMSTTSSQLDLTNLFARIPWMTFSVVAQPNAGWFEQNRQALLEMFHRTSQTTTEISTATATLKTSLNEVVQKLSTVMQQLDQLGTTTATGIMDEKLAILEQVQAISTSSQGLSGISGGLPAGLVPQGFNGVFPPGGFVNPFWFNPGPWYPNGNGRTNSPPLPDLSHATTKWIWTHEANVNFAASQPPAGGRPFRKTYTTPTLEYMDMITIDIACDNFFTLYVNGYEVGSTILGEGPNGWEWRVAHRFKVRFYTPTPTVNVAIFGIQSTELAQAGVIADCVLWSTQSNNVYEFGTDETWKTVSSNSFSDNFIYPGAPDQGWENALVLGDFNTTQPWAGQVAKPTTLSDWTPPLKTGAKITRGAPVARPADVQRGTS
ncbi:hypothetical protein M422DRAFT_784380 [Sphaerobolus stellatus SS14]|uniref:Uncharacterized protein n=1 Tax=Sphaerobolus stellatus (strain SS14) TaxID=990650 RepID=A0A0C9UJY0_SPHS4|nr:hypothetical protein M422DRAFT_784380 [Sphaerobolus stellatus SS14]